MLEKGISDGSPQNKIRKQQNSECNPMMHS